MELKELIAQADIVEYIAQFCELKEKNGEWWGLSPLKDEQTPSFSIDKNKQLFYDFSSGKGGDVLDFIKVYNKTDTRSAVRILADYLGVDGEGVQTTASPLAHTIKAIKKYGCKARDKKVACSTNLGDDYMARYDRSLEKLAVWEYEGIPIEVLDFFQVRYDSVSNRLVYPIRDTGGNIINVCGRTLDPDFKAKRLPKYIYFKPLGTLATLFGWSENIEQIKQRKEVIIFEGAKSVMLARAWGINNTAALLTSHLNSNQLRLLLSLGCQLTFALDKEVDITEDKNILILKQYQKVYTIRDRHDLTGDKDAPVDKGEEVFRKLYSEKEAIN